MKKGKMKIQKKENRKQNKRKKEDVGNKIKRRKHSEANKH